MSSNSKRDEDLAAYFPDDPIEGGANFNALDPTRLPAGTYCPDNYELFWAAKDRVGYYKAQGCVVHPKPPEAIDDAHAAKTMVLMGIHRKTKAANRRNNKEMADANAASIEQKFRDQAGKAFVPIR